MRDLFNRLLKIFAVGCAVWASNGHSDFLLLVFLESSVFALHSTANLFRFKRKIQFEFSQCPTEHVGMVLGKVMETTCNPNSIGCSCCIANRWMKTIIIFKFLLFANLLNLI